MTATNAVSAIANSSTAAPTAAAMTRNRGVPGLPAAGEPTCEKGISSQSGRLGR